MPKLLPVMCILKDLFHIYMFTVAKESSCISIYSTFIHVHIHMHTYMTYIHDHTYMHTCIHTCTHTYTHHIHTYIHDHTTHSPGRKPVKFLNPCAVGRCRMLR